MNRALGTLGILAASMAFLMACMAIWLPWVFSIGRGGVPLWAWLVWIGMIMIGLVPVLVFVRCSLKGHWKALLHNAPLSQTAWRGAFGVYLLDVLMFALPMVDGDPYDTHHAERWLYSVLACCCLALALRALGKGFFTGARDGAGAAQSPTSITPGESPQT